MAKKYDIAERKRAVVRTLEQTGNLTLAAEKARVAREWVRRHRKLDPSFDEHCRAAIAAAKVSLAGADGAAPPAGLRTLNGAELVVRGAPGRRMQIQRARADGWSPVVERRFLDALASSCNVRVACAEISMTVASAYYHRRQFPAFERAWDEAVEIGYTQLEDALVMAGRNIFTSDEPIAPSPIREMTARQAIHLLHMHKAQARGVGSGPHKILMSPVDEAAERLAKVLRAYARERLSTGTAEERAWAEDTLRTCG